MVVVVVRAAGRGVEGRDAVEVEDEILPVAHWAGVVLVPRQAHCGERKKRRVQGKVPGVRGGGTGRWGQLSWCKMERWERIGKGQETPHPF